MTTKLTAKDVLHRYMDEDLPEFSGIDLIDVNQKGQYGNTPLDAAAVSGNVEEIEALLNGGADPDIQGEHGCTPLYNAVAQVHLEAVRLLLSRGAKPAIRSGFGDTPHERALKKGLTEIAALFQHLTDK